MLLHIAGILPKSNAMLTSYSERHSILLPALDIIKSALLIFASVALWRMSKLAFKLFLTELVIATIAAWYLACYAPTPSTIMLRHAHGSAAFFAVIGFALLLEALRCGCAWWITSTPSMRSEQNFDLRTN
jgi:hypothetical protein